MKIAKLHGMNLVPIVYDEASDLPIELQQALSMGVGLAVANRYPINTIAIPAEAAISSENKESLVRYWRITDRETALQKLDWLLNHGHREEWSDILADIKRAAILRDTPIHSFAENLKKNLHTLKRQGIISGEQDLQNLTIDGWDLGRVVLVARDSCAFGYISVAEARDYIMKSFEKARTQYGCWLDFAQSYMLGRLAWGGVIKGQENVFGLAYATMLDWPDSIWNQYPLQANSPTQAQDQRRAQRWSSRLKQAYAPLMDRLKKHWGTSAAFAPLMLLTAWFSGSLRYQLIGMVLAVFLGGFAWFRFKRPYWGLPIQMPLSND